MWNLRGGEPNSAAPPDGAALALHLTAAPRVTGRRWAASEANQRKRGWGDPLQ